MVAVPIKLYSAFDSAKDVSFNTLHAKSANGEPCGKRVKQQFVCSVDSEVVLPENTVKGIESGGRFLTFTPEEIASLKQESSEAIEITEFVPCSAVDPMLYAHTYYVGPDKGGDRPFLLLTRALLKTGQVALARHNARGKQYLVLLRATDAGLVMHQLHYADEIKPINEIEAPQAQVSEAEIALAVQLIEASASDAFDHSVYKNEVKDRMLQAIEAKQAGTPLPAIVAAPVPQVVDLMEALKASIASKPKKVVKAAPAPTPAPVKAAKTPVAVVKANGKKKKSA
jgi:DNA end-binding protein Ku